MDVPICTEPWCVFVLVFAYIGIGILLGQFFHILFDVWEDWKNKK